MPREPPNPMSSATPAEQFLRILREQGGRAGNGKLRDLLGMSEDAYAALWDQLAAQGAIRKGRGQGGSVALAGETPVQAQAQPEPDLLAALAPLIAAFNSAVAQAGSYGKLLARAE